MSIQTKEVAYAHEFDEVLVAVEELLKDIVAKKDVGVLAAENLPTIIAAVDKLDQVDDEKRADAKAFYSTAGYRLGTILSIFVD